MYGQSRYKLRVFFVVAIATGASQNQFIIELQYFLITPTVMKYVGKQPMLLRRRAQLTFLL